MHIIQYGFNNAVFTFPNSESAQEWYNSKDRKVMSSFIHTNTDDGGSGIFEGNPDIESITRGESRKVTITISENKVYVSFISAFATPLKIRSRRAFEKWASDNNASSGVSVWLKGTEAAEQLTIESCEKIILELL